MIGLNVFLQTGLKNLRQSEIKIIWPTQKNLNSNEIINSIEKNFLKPIISPEIGDLVKIGFIITEGNKERTQYYEGTVISKKNSGINLSLRVRRVSLGIGTERVFFLHSPKIASINIKQHGKIRRSKLYFLRQRIGKAIRLKQRFK